MDQGTIIILNGTSSAGKSSIARALQAHLPAPSIHTGIDHFLERTAPGFIEVLPAGASAEVPGFAAFFSAGELVAVRLGPAGYRLLAGMYHAAAGLALAGVQVILDDVIYDPAVLRSAVSILAPYRPLFVGIQCPVDVAVAREQARGDRALGGARTFAPLVHAHGCYDLEIDSAANTPEACAAQIAAALARSQPRTAFIRMAAEYAAPLV